MNVDDSRALLDYNVARLVRNKPEVRERNKTADKQLVVWLPIILFGVPLFWWVLDIYIMNVPFLGGWWWWLPRGTFEAVMAFALAAFCAMLMQRTNMPDDFELAEKIMGPRYAEIMNRSFVKLAYMYFAISLVPMWLAGEIYKSNPFDGQPMLLVVYTCGFLVSVFYACTFGMRKTMLRAHLIEKRFGIKLVRT
jgi:hypothetical protein